MMGSGKRSIFFTSLLALTGLALSLLGAVSTKEPPHSGGVLLWVNDRPISSVQFDALAMRMGLENIADLSSAQREQLATLLIDEELLLQRAEILGLQQLDPSVRKALVKAAIDDVVTDFLSHAPSQEALEAFYLAHQAVFEQPHRIAVSVLHFPDETSAAGARQSLLAGVSWQDVAGSHGGRQLSHIPGTPMTPGVLRRSLGPGLARAALALEVGENSQVVSVAGEAYLLRVTQRTGATTPDFIEIEQAVEAEYLSRGREMALAQALEALRKGSDIRLSPALPVDLDGSSRSPEVSL